MNTLLKTFVRATYYPTLWFNRLMCALRLWRRWDWIDQSLALGSLPSRADLAELQSQGVSAVVNLCAEFAGHSDQLTACGMTQLHLPTLDYACPSQGDLIRGMKFISTHAAAGRKVYVHCKAGRFRSPILVLCYLMAAANVSAAQAFAIVRSVRPQVNRRLDRRPVVRAVEQLIRAQSSGQAQERAKTHDAPAGETDNVS